MVCNYTYNSGLIYGNLLTGDIISCTVPNWVYLMSLIVDLPGSPRLLLNWFKLLMVVAGTIGISMMAYCDSYASQELFRGAVWNLISALLYAVYAIALNAIVTDQETFDYGLFLGFVGLINIVWMGPLMIILHYSQVSMFEPPSLEDLASKLGFAILCSLCYEYFWAKCTTLLGPFSSTVWFTAIMLPIAMTIDLVVWPDP